MYVWNVQIDTAAILLTRSTVGRGRTLVLEDDGFGGGMLATECRSLYQESLNVLKILILTHQRRVQS